jgi:hypothetical protein
MLEYEMGMSIGRAMLVVVFPPSVNLADARAVEHAIEGIDQDRIYLTGGSARPIDASRGNDGQ